MPQYVSSDWESNVRGGAAGTYLRQEALRVDTWSTSIEDRKGFFADPRVQFFKNFRRQMHVYFPRNIGACCGPLQMSRAFDLIYLALVIEDISGTGLTLCCEVSATLLMSLCRSELWLHFRQSVLSVFFGYLQQPEHHEGSAGVPSPVLTNSNEILTFSGESAVADGDKYVEEGIGSEW